MKSGKWLVIIFFPVFLFAVDNQKLLDCYEIFDQKKAELEAEAEKLLEKQEAFEALKNTYMALMKKKEEKLKQKEKERLFYFMLAKFNGNVTIILPPNKNDEIKKFIEQYIGILRRVVLEDTEVNSLCSKIYKDHKKASPTFLWVSKFDVKFGSWDFIFKNKLCI